MTRRTLPLFAAFLFASAYCIPAPAQAPMPAEGKAPAPKTALQAPVYALCAQERLEARDGAEWRIEEASYLALSGSRNHVPIVQAGARDAAERLTEARTRVMAVVDAVSAGDFPPRPLDEMSCRRCPYASVCRKDYVGDD